jgi:hypothetical protein|tara:strand:- start:17460 stop:17699 length:240 start_codon:yes stop_codon:yes gene_type:complete
MMRNLRITASSILSILILLGLMFFFSVGFGIVLLIFFVTKLFGTFFKKKSVKPDISNPKSQPEDNPDIVDVDKDDYKID